MSGLEQELLGIVEDGTQRSPELPRSAATTILIPQNAPAQLDVVLYYASGVPVQPGVGALASWSATMAISLNADPCQVIPDVELAGTLVALDAYRNRLRFQLLASHFRGKPLGRYLFDVWLISGTQRWQVVPVSALILTAGLLRR